MKVMEFEVVKGRQLMGPQMAPYRWCWPLIEATQKGGCAGIVDQADQSDYVDGDASIYDKRTIGEYHERSWSGTGSVVRRQHSRDATASSRCYRGR